MGILKRSGLVIGILIECFILFFPAAYLGETITTFNETMETIATTYNSNYAVVYDRIYHTRYQEGYKNGREIGYKEGLASQTELHNPIYKELTGFLARDKTDSRAYLEGEYVCFDFAAEVNNNAESEGIRAAYVQIRFPKEPGHAIVAFETVDKGLVFIEPQSDEEVELVIGEPYPWQSADANRSTDDDVIVEIQIIW